MLLLIACLTFSLDFRGVWIPRWSLSDRERIFSLLGDDFNHLFVQIFALGEAWYPSAVVPRHSGNGEWLADFIAEAHRRRIKVSAWINVLYSWGYASPTQDPTHPLNRHPNWFVVGPDGRSILNLTPGELRSGVMEGYYLAPAHPEVKEYLCRLVEELARNYDLDGIHFDYIRYPNRRYIWDVQLRTKFSRRYSVDPLILLQADSTTNRFGRGGYEDLLARWQTVVNDDLTEFVAEMTRRIKAVKPHMLVSAAVKPDFRQARDEYGQDWLSWLNENKIDFVCLMAYGRSIQSILTRDLEAVQDPRRVIVGLGAYQLDEATIREQAALVRRLPFGGATIFSYEEIKKNRAYADALKP